MTAVIKERPSLTLPDVTSMADGWTPAEYDSALKAGASFLALDASQLAKLGEEIITGKDGKGKDVDVASVLSSLDVAAQGLAARLGNAIVDAGYGIGAVAYFRTKLAPEAARLSSAQFAEIVGCDSSYIRQISLVGEMYARDAIPRDKDGQRVPFGVVKNLASRAGAGPKFRAALDAPVKGNATPEKVTAQRQAATRKAMAEVAKDLRDKAAAAKAKAKADAEAAALAVGSSATADPNPTDVPEPEPGQAAGKALADALKANGALVLKFWDVLPDDVRGVILTFGSKLGPVEGKRLAPTANGRKGSK